MYKYDINTGEPSYDGSPPSSPMSEQEILNNANMVGTYDIDPSQRYFNQQQYQQPNYYQQPMYSNGYYNPAMQGFNQNYYGNAYMNQPYGYQQQSGFSGYTGAPYYNNQGGYYNQQPNNYGFYQQQYGGYNNNPYGYAYQQQPVVREYTYYIPPFNTGTTELYQSDAMDQFMELYNQMQREMEESYVSRLAKNKEYFNSIGYGYAYMNQTNPYDPAIANKYQKKFDEMKQKATDARTNLNKRLSRIASAGLNNGEVDEERINELYSGQVITVSQATAQQDYDCYRASQAVDIDTSIPYKQAYHEASAIYNKYFDRNTDMATFFNNIGQVIVEERMEEERHRRRNFGQLYQNGYTYRSLIRQKLYEKNGLSNDQGRLNPNDFTKPTDNIPGGSMVPTLNQSARLLDDGTLEVHAPQWLSDNMSVHVNAEEDQYEVQRRKFGLGGDDNQDPNLSRFVASIYRDNPRPTGEIDPAFKPGVNQTGPPGTPKQDKGVM